jgi:hypothetical protein
MSSHSRAHSVLWGEWLCCCVSLGKSPPPPCASFLYSSHKAEAVSWEMSHLRFGVASSQQIQTWLSYQLLNEAMDLYEACMSLSSPHSDTYIMCIWTFQHVCKLPLMADSMQVWLN